MRLFVKELKSIEGMKRLLYNTIRVTIVSGAAVTGISGLYGFLRVPEAHIFAFLWGAFFGAILWGVPVSILSAFIYVVCFLWFNDYNNAVILVCTGLVIIGVSIPIYLRHQTRINIEHRYEEVCSAIMIQQNAAAYRLMTPEYQSQHTLDQFINDGFYQRMAYHGGELDDCELEPRHRLLLSSDSATLYTDHIPYLELDHGMTYKLVRVDGEWYFTGENYLWLH